MTSDIHPPPVGGEPAGRLIEAGDVRVHVVDAGAGPPVVLLHGGGPGASFAGNFTGNIPYLSSRFRLLGMDLPGYGSSDKPEYDGPYMPFAAEAVFGTLDTLGLDRVSVIGNSLGGGVALHMALLHPERVDRLILIGAAGGAHSVITPSPSEGIKHLIGFYEDPGPSLSKMEGFLRVMMYDQSKVTPAVVQERYEAAVDPERREGVLRVYRALAGGATVSGEEVWKRLDEVTCPTLLVWGRDDRILPLDGGIFMLGHLADARLHVFPRCGHWAQVEHQAAFNRLAFDFLTEPTEQG